MQTRSWALYASFFALAGSPAFAHVQVFEPAAGSVLRAGTFVEVHWTGIPQESDELEVLLWLGDGARVPIRLTGELDGRTRSFTWRVPNLPSANARLFVRFEEDGREAEGESGPAFTILGDKSRPIEAVRLHCGELWTGTGPTGSSAPEAGLAEGRDSHVETGMVVHPVLATFREDLDAAPVLAGTLTDALTAGRLAIVPAPSPGLEFLRGISQRK